MDINNLEKAIREVNEILKYIPEKEKNKINSNFLNFLEENQDKNYNFEIDPNKELSEQNMLEETKTLLCVIYRNYWCNAEERIKIDAKLRENEKKYIKEIEKKYGKENLFSNKAEKKQQNTDNLPAVVKKENWFKRLAKSIKNLFKRKQKN